MFTTAITAIATLLASATFLWCASILIIIAMAILLEYEKEGWATTLFSIGIALFLWNFKSNIWDYLSSNPTTTIGFSISYVLMGIAWSFFKWRTYVKVVFTRFKEIKADFIRKNGEITSANQYVFNKIIDQSHFSDPDGIGYVNIYKENTLVEIIHKISPVASHKKSVITAWISYWPVSVTATLLNNPFRKFFEWVYSNISGYYDKITDNLKEDALGV